jgi:hypothetical protein
MNTPSTVKVRDAADVERLLDLVASGHSVAAASRAMGKDSPADIRRMQRLFHEAMQEAFNENVGLREEVLAKELHTLDLLQRKIMPEALRGDTKAGKLVLEILDRRSKYLGLDQPAKVQVEITRVDDAVREITGIIDGSFQVAELDRIELESA